MWRSEENLRALVLLCHHVESERQTQAIRLLWCIRRFWNQMYARGHSKEAADVTSPQYGEGFCCRYKRENSQRHQKESRAERGRSGQNMAGRLDTVRTIWKKGRPALARKQRIAEL